MYSRKLNLSQLHKTTIGKHWIKIHAPQKSGGIRKWLGRIGLLIIVTFVVLLTGYKYCPECVEYLLSLNKENTTHSCQAGDHLDRQLSDDCPVLVDIPEHVDSVQLPRAKAATVTNLHQPPKEPVTMVQTINQHVPPHSKQFSQESVGLPVPKVVKVSPKSEVILHELVGLPVPNVVKILSKAEVIVLLQKCVSYLNANHLTIGKDGTAFDCYHQVLAQEANNVQAQEGIAQIEARYQYWAERALKSNKLQSARKYINQLRKVNPHSPTLIKLQQRLQAQSTRSKPKRQRSKPKQQRSKPKKPKTRRSSPRSLQCINILSQESLGIIPLNQKQKRLKQQHCGQKK